MTVLILGGTGEARALAAALDETGVPILSSLAGRVQRPRLPVGPTRIGGFGGPDGLAAFLSEQAIHAVVDATHPFAKRISASAAQACGAAGVPLLRLERPGWAAGEGDRWTWVDDLPGAARAVAASGAQRVFLTSGRQGLAAFAGLASPWFLIRCVDPPDVPLPAHHELLLDRGPYTEPDEGKILDRQRIDLLVTKDSGGPLTAAKLAAARDRGIPVVVVRRPSRPDVATVATVAESVSWLRGQDDPIDAGRS